MHDQDENCKRDVLAIVSILSPPQAAGVTVCVERKKVIKQMTGQHCGVKRAREAYWAMRMYNDFD